VIPTPTKRRWFKEMTLLVSSLLANQFSFSLYESFYLPGFLINRFLSKKPPIVKKWLLLELTFSKLHLEFLDQDQELKLHCDVTVQMLNDRMWFGNVTLQSSYTFDPNSKQFFLKNPKINSFSFDGLHEKAEQLIEKVSPSIGSFFNGYPIYELSEDDIKFLKKTPSSIVIEPGGIRFKFD
jgi:hypothetical protein